MPCGCWRRGAAVVVVVCDVGDGDGYAQVGPLLDVFGCDPAVGDQLRDAINRAKLMESKAVDLFGCENSVHAFARFGEDPLRLGLVEAELQQPALR